MTLLGWLFCAAMAALAGFALHISSHACDTTLFALGKWEEALKARPSGKFIGVVRNAGGGQVDVIVDRDLDRYPDFGQPVYVYVDGES